MKKQKIKIAMSSDIHNNKWPDFEKADVLTFAGDFSDCRPKDMFRQILQFERLMKELLEQAYKFKQIFIIFGNHDTFAKDQPRHPEIIKWETIFRNNGTRLDFLFNEIRKYEGVTFYGNSYNMPVAHSRLETRVPASLNSNWAFHWTEETERKTQQFLMNHKPQVMITHAPCRNILDINHQGEHCGEWRWHEYLDDYRPELWISGHIHESHGIKVVEDTTYVNASIMSSYHGQEQILQPVQYIEMEFESRVRESIFPIVIEGITYTKEGKNHPIKADGKEISAIEWGEIYITNKYENLWGKEKHGHKNKN